MYFLRLKEERERLMLTQAQFCAIGEVSDVSQRNYETGRRFPDINYLMNLLKIGVDVNYIITGKRSSAGNERADAIYTAFESADASAQAIVCKILDLDFSSLPAPKEAPAKATKTKTNTMIGRQVINNNDNAVVNQIFKQDGA